MGTKTDHYPPVWEPARLSVAIPPVCVQPPRLLPNRIQPTKIPRDGNDTALIWLLVAVFFGAFLGIFGGSPD